MQGASSQMSLAAANHQPDIVGQMVMQGASSQWQQHMGAQRKPSRPSGATLPDVKLVAHAGTGTAVTGMWWLHLWSH